MPAIHDFPALQQALAPLRRRLVAHPIYTCLHDLDSVRVFMTHHVFAVWDFMSLLKALQRQLTCVEPVWRPRGDAVARRLINEIVLGEESDDDRPDGYISHFELYRRAMDEAGADGAAIAVVLARVEAGESVFAALAAAPPPARRFCNETFTLVADGSLPALAAAFTIGREDVIPDMFTALVADLHRQQPGGLPTLVDYLDRHIHLDGERHGPMAVRMLTSVCGTDAARWEQARAGAAAALSARLAFWDGIQAALPPLTARAASR
ncbi:MAG: DUF3050 domain-containing protein [Planctomycetes bacterium]|nr:DUF3050 domain-containing protein [Planctomycetota bacterium]